MLMGILRQDADGDPVKFPLRQMFTARVWSGTVFVVENLWLGLVPLAVVWVLHLIHGRQLGKQRVLGELVLLAAVAGILFTAVSLWQTPGSYGKAENTVSAAMMRLVPYPEFGDSYTKASETLVPETTWGSASLF